MGGSQILTINAGSSSIKCALFDAVSAKQLRQVTYQSSDNFFSQLIEWFDDAPIEAVGHRIVHGGNDYTQPVLATSDVISRLEDLIPLDPQHLPTQLHVLKLSLSHFNHQPQVLCFDTAFHSQMPEKAQTLPLPIKYRRRGLRKFGFHGLSYESILDQLIKIDPKNQTNRIIVAHLGSGASLAAIHNSQSIDTTMGFSPASGIMMSTRSGDIDPNLYSYLAQYDRMSAKDIRRLFNFESGLLGLSGQTGSMKQLIALEQTNHQAALAIDMFCYSIQKTIGSYVAAMNGLDVLVFTGGIGEAAPMIRQRVCQQLSFIGIDLDKQANTQNQPLISSPSSLVKVYVLETNEAAIIANHTKITTRGDL